MSQVCMVLSGSAKLWAWTFINTTWSLQYISEGTVFLRLLEVFIPVFKNVGERSTAKNHCPVSPLSVVRKICKELLNNRLVGHLKKCDFLEVTNKPLINELLIVLSENIFTALNMSGATRAGALDICKTRDRIWHASLLHKLCLKLFSCLAFGLT